VTSLLLALALAASAKESAGAPEVVLVVIDEATEKALGWPLPSGVLAEGLDKIEAGKPAAVALKFFVEGDDEAVSAALARHKNVFLQCAGIDEGAAPDLESLRRSAISGGDGADFDDKPKVLFPSKGLAKAAAGVGFVHVKLNAGSGAAERWQVVSMAGGKRYASLALLLAAKAKGFAPASLTLKQDGIEKVLQGKTDLGQVRGAIVTFAVAGADHTALKMALRQQAINVSVSTQFSSRLDLKGRGLSDVLRASVHVYNTEAELDRFVAALEAVIKRGG